MVRWFRAREVGTRWTGDENGDIAGFDPPTHRIADSLHEVLRGGPGYVQIERTNSYVFGIRCIAIKLPFPVARLGNFRVDGSDHLEWGPPCESARHAAYT